jgi:hypothetical protein
MEIMGKTEEKTYCNGKHPNQDLYLNLLASFSPEKGKPESFDGSLLNSASMLLLDWSHNGLCNYPHSDVMLKAVDVLDRNQASFNKFLKKRQSWRIVLKILERAKDGDLDDDALRFDAGGAYFEDVLNAVVCCISDRIKQGVRVINIGGKEISI